MLVVCSSSKNGDSATHSILSASWIGDTGGVSLVAVVVLLTVVSSAGDCGGVSLCGVFSPRFWRWRSFAAYFDLLGSNDMSSNALQNTSLPQFAAVS